MNREQQGTFDRPMWGHARTCKDHEDIHRLPSGNQSWQWTIPHLVR